MIKWGTKKSYNIEQKFDVIITKNKGNAYHGSDVTISFKPGLTDKITITDFICVGKEGNKLYFGGGNYQNGWKIGKYKSVNRLKLTEHSAGLGRIPTGNFQLEFDADQILYFVDLTRDLTNNSITWGKKGK